MTKSYEIQNYIFESSFLFFNFFSQTKKTDIERNQKGAEIRDQQTVRYWKAPVSLSVDKKWRQNFYGLCFFWNCRKILEPFNSDVPMVTWNCECKAIRIMWKRMGITWDIWEFLLSIFIQRDIFWEASI